MNVVIIDLELNQAENREERIIQVGAVFVNLRSGTLKSKFNVYCNPEEHIVPFITELCGITQEMVDEAPLRSEAFKQFWDWYTRCNPQMLIAWGSDVKLLTKQCVALGVQVPKKIRELNLKEMFKWYRSASGKSIQGGLANSLGFAGLTFLGRHHDAYDDAYNTGRLAVWAYAIIRRAFDIEKLYQRDKELTGGQHLRSGTEKGDD